MNNLDINQSLNIEQTLELMLSPRMLQMLKMLNLSYVDLVQEIENKSEENVMLELEKPDRLLEYLKQISTERISRKEIYNEELPGIETLADTAETLADHLLKQLDLEDIDEKEKKIAQMIISGVDSRGYISDYKELSSTIYSELKADQKSIDDALELVQSLEPEGVGARDLKECLLIQVREHNFENEDLENVLIKVIDNHLEDIAEKKYDAIAKALKIKKDGVIQLADFIKNNLNPNPCSAFAEKLPCVIPSFSVKKENDKYKIVNLEKTYGPVLKISSTYEKMLKDPKTDQKTTDFLKEKLFAAKDFLENLNKRHETIEKILNMIVDTQSHFFDSGDAQLSPLMQKNIADELGLHPSTISRAISNKYIQTPKGILVLKCFCPRNIKGSTKKKIMKLIDDMIIAEDKRSPLSDEQIAEKLEGSGIKLERRTIAQYRKNLGYEPASKRVKF
jgi:RNA polymerase sigma-54 factor